MNGSCRRGFTLIEILLATMIVAMIGGSLYAVFSAGFKLDRRITTAFIDLDESRIIIEQLRRDLGRVVDYDFRGSYPQQKAFFDDGKVLFFLINDDGQLRWVRYFIDEGKKEDVKSTVLGVVTKKNIAVSDVKIEERSQLNLLREEGDFIQLFDSLVPARSERLTRRIAERDGWKIQYAKTVTPQTQVEWKSLWNEDNLPAALRLILSLRDDKGRIKMITRDFILPAGGRNEP